MKTKIKVGDYTYQIEISELKDNLLKVRVDGSNYFFSRNELGEITSVEPEAEELKNLIKEGEVYLESLVEKEIKSPLTGTISSIEVKEGQNLKPGQKVVTLIAMKMENEIISESYGQVKEVKVKENQSVNTGQVLIILK